MLEYHNSLFGEDAVMGIDEAGRGPVLGPMVYACFYCTAAGETYLKKLKVDDSKKLTEMTRERLFDTFWKQKSLFGWIIHSLSPSEISSKMLRKEKYNLNEISHDTAISLIKSTLNAGIALKQVFVDTVGNSTSYQIKLQKHFPSLKIVVTEKADSKFAVVSAASICAKVSRDRILRQWKYVEEGEFSTEFGSGYPGDPVTKSYLNKTFHPLFGYPSIVRFSWNTIKDIMEKKEGIKIEWYEEEETSPLLQYYPPNPKEVTTWAPPTHCGAPLGFYISTNI
ncbi:putative ribonuclease H1 large subunit [Cardiosporidium cionae]|uniref:Ribonuclease n=1 Tax=Cardiosporidium cionae TaxID=476202 RepID=A0ABQ7JEL1_9APIC|nr:putative ribonuclease H1 large subunit [Cardiosporidium cionae]|eukprot:KAF8822408.1 putative ribonuclease H1 large subunit [Cardiosporidium cionae]